MAWPTLSVQIDSSWPPLTPLDSNVWKTVTEYVLEINIRRGRSDALGRVEAGTASILFDNSNRTFDPNYTVGLMYPGVDPMRKIRIRATYSAVEYYLFVGYITSWPPDWPGGLDATARIEAVDAFSYFARKKLNGAYASEYSNWSIDTWLTNMDWPAADRQLFSGQSQIQSGTFVNTPALQHFQNVADVESGLFYVDQQGRPTFHNRHYRLTNSQTSSATYGDQSPELPWLKTTKVYNDDDIWNEARITRTGGTEQVATDTASQAAYFTRTYTKTLPMLTDVEALSLAQYIVGKYANPIFRYTSVTLDGQMDDALWVEMLSRVISERITIVERPPGGAVPDVITQACYIEGVSHTITQDTWQTTFQLSAADSFQYWVLDSATLSVLDTSTRLAY